MKRLFEATYKTIKSILKQYSERSVGAYSAQAAYFIFASFFPFAIIIFYVINAIPNFNLEITEDAIGIIPQMLLTIIEEAKSQATINGQRLIILLVSALAALWSASKGIYGISLGLDSVYQSKKKRNSIFARIRATLYTLAFVVIIIAVLGLLVFGNTIYENAIEYFPNYAVVLFMVRSFRFIALLLILIFFFTMTYKFLPSEKRRIGEVLPGAVIASIGWLVFSYLYSLYIDHYDVSSSVYGSLATIVLLMLWLYFCMNIVLSGALVNSWLSEGRIRPNQKNEISVKDN